MGITPAYAGKSCIYRSTTSISWDHPRVCGEKSFKTSTSCWSKGSPPRMRGKAKCQLDNVRCGRITPAYAGKSFSPSACIGHYRDHPRVCGEKPGSKQPENPHQGSPPRMRGKGLSAPPACWQIGITPAYAGKSTGGTHAHKCARDHPRVCGEKLRLTAKETPCRGSPPRMRGKGTGFSALGSASGITPAYAGKSVPLRPLGVVAWDHPRVCGEKCISAIFAAGMLGSPPRMRGKAPRVCKDLERMGITPAYAGKSSCGS